MKDLQREREIWRKSGGGGDACASRGEMDPKTLWPLRVRTMDLVVVGGGRKYRW